MVSRASSQWMTGPATLEPLVLVVEDEPQMRRFLVSTLASNGFRSVQVGTKVGALARTVGREPDLVVLDVSHPGVDGVEVTARLRDWTSAPILVVLGEGGDQEGFALLDAGASDYIVKPFGKGELLARLRVWLTQAARAQRPRLASQPPVERLRIDRERRSLIVEGREVHITPLECKLLVALARTPGSVLTEEQIVAAVWGAGASRQTQYLRAHVRQLRQKIEKDPNRPRHLLMESGGGYRLKLS